EAIPPEGWLFPASRGGSPLRPNNYLKRDLVKLCKAAGVGRIDLRRLRRTCATYLRDEAAAQGQLRHSSGETTKRHLLESHSGRAEGSRGAPRRRAVRVEEAGRDTSPKAASVGESAGEVDGEKRKRKRSNSFRMWYARVDSNHRPFAPENHEP